MDQNLLQNADGRILLEAHNGQIQSPKTGSQLTRGRFGAIENWLTTRHRVTWPVKIAQPGTYDIVVLTQTDRDGKWEGGHRARLTIGRTSISGIMRDQERRDNPKANAHLLDVVARIGQIRIDKPGTHDITLRMEKVIKKKGRGPKLRAVQLIPV